MSNHLYWYHFSYGKVFIIQLSTEHDMSKDSLQYAFLEQALASVDRRVTPFVVVTIHRPIYFAANAVGNQLTSLQLRSYLEDIFLEYEVDLVLGGHQHWYERTCLIHKGECLEDTELSSLVRNSTTMESIHHVAGTRQTVLQEATDTESPVDQKGKIHKHGIYHITIGTAGAPIDRSVDLLKRKWNRVWLQQNGYGRLHYFPPSQSDRARLVFEFVRNDDGGIADSVTVHNRFN
jgi:hypothetical protein